MKTGDLEPSWLIDIASGDTATDFADVLSWRITAVRDTTNGPVTVFTDTTPNVIPGAVAYQVTLEHDWADGETDVAGTLLADPVAVWPGGREQTFPTAYQRIEDSND